MIVLAVVLGYLIGSAPTAGWLASLVGIDLRANGSKNPGANNARKLGGIKLAATVLIVEISKGVIAVFAGVALAGSWGGLSAGLGALAGNVYNVWYRFEGGQGLGISAGILLAAWPLFFPVVVAVIAGVAYLTKSAPKAALAAVGVLLIGIGAAFTLGFPSGWGLESDALGWLGIGVIALVAPKQLTRIRPE